MQRFVAAVLLLIWLAVSLAALAAMYNLWWSRERVRYVGHSVEQQRQAVFTQAGFPDPLLGEIERIRQEWPPDVRYGIEGDYNRLSYAKYLLIPRMPSGEKDFLLTVDGDHLRVSPPLTLEAGNSVAKEEHPARPQGFVLSLLAVTGLVVLLREIGGHEPNCLLNSVSCPPISLTIPEAYGAAAFLLMVAAVFSRALSGNSSFGFLLITILGGFGLCAGAWRIRRFGRAGMLLPGCGKERLLYGAAGIFVLAIFFWSILMSVVVVPDDWDAWAMWGAKAKTLALGTGPLHDVTLFGHTDYPLLWPSVWAFSGWAAGGWEEHWSRAWSPVFMLLAVWQMGLVVRHVTRSVSAGWLAAVLFLSMPKIPLLASWSYAETPFWLMLACAFGNFLLWQREQSNALLLKVCFFSMVAAYTKNEGIVFSMLCLLWICLEKPTDCLRNGRFFLVPWLVFYLPWAAWVRVSQHLDSRHLDGFSGDSMTFFTAALSRLPDTLSAIGRLWTDVRQWNIVLGGVILFSLIMIFRSRQVHRRGLLLPWALLAVYLGITLSYADTLWLVGTAWDRLTAQGLLLLLLAVGVGCRCLTVTGQAVGNRQHRHCVGIDGH